MRSRTALLIFAALAVFHTWPLASSPAHFSLNHNADAELNAWAMSWIAHTLPRDPMNLFNTNIFAPEQQTLTYSEPLIVPALVGAPVWWMGGSTVLAFNLSLLTGLALTGWATWLVAARWTGSAGAALVAGSLAAFNPHLLTRLPHITAVYAWTIPLSFYLADRLIDEPRPQTGVWLALIVAATAANSIYWLALVGIVVGIVMAAAAVMRKWRAMLTIAASAISGLMLAAPILWPYVRFAGTGASRPLETVPQFSATLHGYLYSSSRLHAGWSAPFFDRDVSVFFAGFGAIALALTAAAFVGARPATTRRRLMLVTVAIVGVVLSLGPATPIYSWLYEWVTPLRGLRAAARFGYLYLVAIALGAAFGVAWIAGRFRHPRVQAVVAAAALAVVTAEAWSAPIDTVPFSRIPPIYHQLRDLPGPVTLVEMPFYPPEAISQNAYYELNSTAHWRPLMNGASGFTPDSYRRRSTFFWYFPEARALDRLRSEGATHVMVHLERFTPQEADDIRRVMRTQSVMSLVASDTQGHLLYKVR